ncbi:hypothetical protein [Paramylibacter kogurei]|uniref:hypothetical protein n=1 Tax=Paramylibacter kogurei TaxID=1889778 RepID=UPI001054C154|nr:hypothetical protein [Amylibacter kogurei]
MNRREFTTSLGALFGAASMPLGAVALPSPHLSKAAMLARAHSQCSIPFLMRHLKVDAQTAAGVLQELIGKNVVSTPMASGIAQAVNPIHINKLPQAIDVMSPDISGRVDQAINQVKKLATQRSRPDDNDTEADDPIPTGHANPE